MATTRLAIVCLMVNVSLGITQDPQPQAEVDIVERFEQESQALFEQWLGIRAEALGAAGLGKRGISACSGTPGKFFVFMECEDIEPPTTFEIDVVRTDSLLSPFVGVIIAPVRERCYRRNVVAGPMMTMKKFVLLSPQCIGKTYRECMDAGGRLASTFLSVNCTGGPGVSFDYEGETTVRYRWSKGKWEFEKQELEPEREPPS